MTINEIKADIAPLFERYKAAYSSLIDKRVPLIDEINRHVMLKPGKQLRPLLSLLTARCCGLQEAPELPHPLYSITAALELLHNSTLIHDDVVDESHTRRGNPTVNHLWGNKIAVLAGDYFLSLVMRIINENDHPGVTRIVNDTALAMSEGELLQQQYCGHYDLDTDLYFDTIRKKTALFMGCCCEIGATLTTSDPHIQQAARQYGENLGMAFQLRDDLLDCLPATTTGKPQGNDLREHKATLPILLTLNRSDKDTKNHLLTLLQKETLTDSDVDTLISHIHQPGILGEIHRIMDNFLLKARQAAEALPDNRFRQDMIGLIQFISTK